MFHAMSSTFASPVPSLSEPFYNDELSMDDNVNDIYAKLLSKSTGCTNIPSLAAPPLATEFVKSKFANRAYAGSEGALAEIRFPPPRQTIERAHKNHGRTDLFSYMSTAAADVYPAGYGERAAKALEREDSIYQLKGTFISASLALSKLRARIEARGGDVASMDRIFARFWGLEESDVAQLPHMHVTGSEHTRMAAMEDRAYHALSGHPAYTGGFRVDLATIAADALGEDVPLNWARIRTGLKTIANAQNNADISMMELRSHPCLTEDVKLYMDLAIGSQPAYRRGSTWEILLDQLMQCSERDLGTIVLRAGSSDIPGMISQTYADQRYKMILADPDLWIQKDVADIASLVQKESKHALVKAVNAIKLHEQDRALIEIDIEDEFDTFSGSKLTKTFNVPKYKVVRESWRGGFANEKLGKTKLPDMESHGKARKFFNLGEVRESNITAPISVSGALNMAVYFISQRAATSIPCYRLLQEVRDPKPGIPGKVAARLRNSKLYASDSVRNLGIELFGEEFRSIFETLLRNLSTPATLEDTYVKSEIWRYLSGRSGSARRCPVIGGWRDLISYLITAEEGWTLYYWVRVAMGKTQRTMSTSILAPIMAGEPVDFLTMISKGVKERAMRWKTHYEAAYQKMEDELGLPTKRSRQKDKDPTLSQQLQEKYLPPHLRDRAMVEARADKEGILNRKRGLKQQVYERLVELQTKIKFFGQVKVVTNNRQLAIGLKDEDLRELFIEFYQMRWYSLELRIQKARKRNEDLHLGPHVFPEHPWGQLCQEFPNSLEAFMQWTTSLDERAWTRTPMWLFERVKKSIGELWSDIAIEIQTVLDYIEQVEDCLADEQTTIVAEARVSSVLEALRGTPAIRLPIPGYISPYSLPERKTTLQEYTNEPSSNPYASTTLTGERFVDPALVVGQEAHDEPEEVGFDFEEDEGDGDIMPTMLQASVQPSAPDFVSDDSKSLTYREIWENLQLGPTTDEMVRFALGISANVNLDSEHLDPMIGPAILFKDREKTIRAWRPKMGGILKRLGKAMELIHSDDM